MQEVNLQFSKSSEDYRVKEAFKTLRTNIEFSGEDVRVIAVTSCTPNEGKSSVAMEMAKAFAEAGNRTILLDADMRKSVLVGRYKTGAVRTGLVHCLIGRAKLEEVICKTNVKYLYVAFSGPVPPNPSELLGGPGFEKMIESLKKVYKYIIIDTPPLGSVIDAAVVAKNCDGVVLVIENNAISYKFAQKVKDQLAMTDTNILGVVLNKVDMNNNSAYGHYGRYYGKYYGNYGDDVSRITPQMAQVAKPINKSAGNRVVDKKMAIMDLNDLELDDIIPEKTKENMGLYNPVVPMEEETEMIVERERNSNGIERPEEYMARRAEHTTSKSGAQIGKSFEAIEKSIQAMAEEISEGTVDFEDEQ